MRPLVTPLVLAAAVLCPTLAHAADGEKVMVEMKDVQVDFGRLHLSVNLLGWEVSGAYDSLVTSVQGLFELNDHIFVRAHSTVPFLGFVGSSNGPVRLEAGVSFHSSKLEVEYESVTLESERSGDMIHTRSVQIPVPNKNSVGLGAGILYRDMRAEVTREDDEFLTRARHLTAYAGLSGLNSAGFEVKVEGYETNFFNYRWFNGGLDVLFDIVQTFGVDPSKSAGRFGGRLWAESIFGPTAGLSGRLEVGYMPGETGWFFSASIGGGLHLL
ncbi:MAG: hypothetical protein JNJ59_13725 [Deltaproteobacteria bacterium]|jgi:hypothetical protein|nr:hypothetical protein [Deltaproteobacteria bacterium]